ncbi:NAD(+) synthase [Alistipes sp.]|uniref:NAD(+) synthase n=1 Tax=Alistipes sp. TaxID=1872444 RepID=UPI003A88071E
MDRYGYLKAAAAIPSVRVADCAYNGGRIAALVGRAAVRGVEVVVFPELSLTGYTCGDLFLQPALLAAAEEALAELVRSTAEFNTAFAVGMPVAVDDMLYNCAVVAAAGEVLGVVPKRHIPAYAEFYESRWFASGAGRPTVEIELCGQSVPFGTDLLFDIDGARCGVEICEDLWVPTPPSSELATAGAEVIFNLSASPETVGKSDYVRQLVAQQSARTRAAYVYCSAGFGESSTDLVFAGNALLAENGTVLAAAERFSLDEQLVVADVDCQLLRNDRCRTTTFRHGGASGRATVAVSMPVADDRPFDRAVEAQPFVPADDDRRHSRCEEILNIQALGLARRLAHTHSAKAVVGISGGLDSTLALLVTVRAFDRLGLDRRGIVGITMPGFGTTDRTYGNALTLMRELGVTVREIPIRAACEQHFRDIGLPADDRSTTYENAQARERTQILMDVANREGALVVGTGDLSELALGWATYNGDQMSMYGVNASVPKTLVRHIVEWYAAHVAEPPVAEVLRDVAATPVSPELLPADAEGRIAQKTEDLVGPYELHDFFLHCFIRQGFSPAKILFLAGRAFEDRYDRPTILRWMKTFFGRFFAQQFKRSAMPDGPKVGSVALSPRGDWRMPSDASAAVWLAEIERLADGTPIDN